MKLPIMLGVAALALAGSAFAQPESDHPSGVSSRPAFDYQDGLRVQSEIFAQLRVAVPQMRLACAADRQTLCSDKKSAGAADRCIRYHRLKVSERCRQAQDHVEMAREGRL